MTMTTTLRDRLAEAQDRKRGIRDRLAAARADVQRARAAYEGANITGKITDAPEFRVVERAQAAVSGLQDQLALADEEERYVLHQIAGTSSELYGDSFLRNPETLRSLAQAAESTAPLGRMQLGIGVAREDLLSELGQGRMMAAAGEATIADTARGTVYRGINRQLRRQLRLLDLIPAAPMDGRSIEYTIESGNPAASAAPVAEGALKPAETWDFLDAEAVAHTIAHYTKLRKQQLADNEQLGPIIRDRLAYGVLQKVEQQVLSGDGSGENLRGILNTTGIASIPYSAGPSADLVLDGIGAVLISEAEPNFVALHPTDFVAMLKAKATGSGEYFSGGPFVAAAERLWGVATVPSTGVTQGSVLVGDATRGATLFVREGVNVIASDSDQDDFVRNRVTLLGEGRFALAVWQPAAFAVVDLTA